ncbi:probable LRR receptor-like serine/threonine-protein kinase At1g53430 [Humulus lupulus]|uniref:probable LRR receptor-like serine/threonine-protein kinase At1g53430 n=1 Tax=Humulus lupulus TaxID=3486 RepID=UPI002B405503|nr:probable LRR receptor-like serine/threonine-protein kinase At1g53430 [Humulus lupulus]
MTVGVLRLPASYFDDLGHSQLHLRSPTGLLTLGSLSLTPTVCDSLSALSPNGRRHPLGYELLSLPKHSDLSCNYLNGSIPPSLSRAPLRILSVLGNRLSGSIPPEIGNIRTLRELN